MSIVGLLARTSAAVLRWRAANHTHWKEHLSRRAEKHNAKAESLEYQSLALDEGADKFAPRKVKVEALPPPPPAPAVHGERRALAAAVANYHPSRREEDCQ